MTNSASFINLMHFISKKDEPKICNFCCLPKPDIHKVPGDPMVGELCAECRGVLETARPQITTKSTSKAPASTPTTTPSKSGVVGWLRGMLEGPKPISRVDLTLAMEKKGYSPSTVKTQMSRILKAYPSNETHINPEVK